MQVSLCHQALVWLPASEIQWQGRYSTCAEMSVIAAFKTHPSPHPQPFPTFSTPVPSKAPVREYVMLMTFEDWRGVAGVGGGV